MRILQLLNYKIPLSFIEREFYYQGFKTCDIYSFDGSLALHEIKWETTIKLDFE